MDIRTMQYYLAVVREGTISAAAQSLHVAQPSLSRQMRELEEELGVSLFVRGNRKITLTEEGMVLRKRAEEMVRLMRMTEDEISQVKNNIAGNINIGAGESQSFHYISRLIANISKDYPDVRFHITSGDTRDLMDELSNGLIDFAMIFTDFDHSIYQSIPLPSDDSFGVLMPKDHELSQKEFIELKDLRGYPLIISRAHENVMQGNIEFSDMRIVSTYNLIYNASLLVEDGLGLAIGFDKLINVSGDSKLCFRPLSPKIKAAGSLIWKKYQVFPPAVQLFIDRLNSL